MFKQNFNTTTCINVAIAIIKATINLIQREHNIEKNLIAQHGVAAESKSSSLPNNDLIKAVDSAHSWKNVYENLQQ